MDKHTITLADGRTLEVLTAGTPSSNAILFHHGTPGSCNTWAEWLPAVAELGGFAISFSRAGYGNSSRHKGRTVIAGSQDSKAILDHFGVKKSVSIGWSGGGPHCLAATTLSENVAAISIAGVAEYGSDDLDFLEGMGEENHIEFGAALAGEETLEAWMKENSGGTANVTGEQLTEALGGLIGNADKRSLTPAVADETASVFRHALSVSYYGWMDDDVEFVQPWGFDIRKITKPVELWQGDEDLMVPHAHGKWLAGKIPTAKLQFEPGEGHISLGINKRSAILKNALGYLAN
jgi:pimeloyl-ACP methyl ester carboxylesterase